MRMLHHLATGLIWATSVAAAFAATPIAPASDDVVVERLPASASASARERRRASTAKADNLELALERATDALTRARRSGDPRDVGEAQAALGPWWSLDAPPPAVRLLRASVRQSQHRFDDARADLDALLHAPSNTSSPAAPPPDPALRLQARLVRAAVHQVQGRIAEARADCDAMAAELRSAGSRNASAARTAQACLAELRSLRGDPDGAARALAMLHAAQPDDAWVALLRAELAQRRGQPLDAARLLEPITSRPGAQVYTIAAHADALLEAGRADAALALIDRATDASRDAGALPDALRLRRAVAQARAGDDRASAPARALQQAFDAARRRGDPPHLREEAWLALDVERDAARAWRLAQDNWTTQKEPIDALLFVRSAVAAAQMADARAFVDRRRAEGWHDLRLARALESAR